MQTYKDNRKIHYINMNKNNNLTQFNEGGLHSQNPNGGIMIGNNASVEQGETLKDNFVYSNRIFLDSNTISQYNLPKSLIGKSVADATKFIDDKFKGRNDKISQSTKNSMLSKIAEAQESMKPAEPGMEQGYPEQGVDPSQMALGGYVNRQMEGGGYYDQNNPYFMQNPGVIQNSAQPNTNVVNQIQPVNQLSQANSLSQIKPFSTGNQLPIASAVSDTAGAISEGMKDISGKTGGGLSSSLGAVSTAIDLGKTAFGKPTQNTDGLAASAKVNSGGMIAGSAMKGASAGMAFGPYGAAIGAVVGAGAGLLGAGKAKKAAIENSNNFALNTNKKFSDQYAFGGPIDPPTKITVDNLINTPIVTGVKPSSQSDRFRYAVGEQGGVQHGTSGEQGHYLYYDKKPGQSGFNPAIHREFVNQSGYDTYMKSPQGQQYRRNLTTQSLQPIEQLGYGGKVKKMADGGYYDKNRPYFMTNPGPTTINPTIGKTGFYGPDILPKQVFNDSSESINIPEREIIPTKTQTQFESYANQQTPIKSSFGQKVGQIGNYVNENAGNLARYAPIAANALQLAQLKKPQGERLDRLSNRYKPEYVDEVALQNIADQTMNNTVNAVSQSGASQGQLRSSLVGSQLQRTKALSDAYSQAAAQNRATNDRAQTFNLGVDQVNLQQSNSEKDINARDQAAYRNEKSKYISAIGNDIGVVGKEEIYKKIAKTTTGYSWLGEYQKMNPNATPEETKAAAEKAGILTDGTTKKALGGYLLKNKRK